jgi:hypothetical protein
MFFFNEPRFCFLHTYLTLTLYSQRRRRGNSDFPPRQTSFTKTTWLTTDIIRNTANVTGDKPIAIWLQSISGVIAVGPLVAFYDILGNLGQVLFCHRTFVYSRDIKIYFFSSVFQLHYALCWA